jgi:hypothetical protein
MQGLFRGGLVVLCIMLVLVQGVPAFTVSRVTIDPSGAVTPGTQTIIAGTIYFEPWSGKNFPDSHELHFVTDLDQAQWNYTLVLDKKETQHLNIGGRILSIDGDTLSFPDSIEESLRFNLSGKVPPVTATRNITLMNISEYEHNNEIAGSAVSFQSVDVYITDVSPQPSAEIELRKFRSEIEKRSTLGVDTSAAEAKYSEAEQKIKAAKSRPSTQYILALRDSDAALKAIYDGEAALDKTWAEKDVAYAQQKISDVDDIIGWFKANSSTANHPNLDSIIAEREVAVNTISAANTEISSGNYEQARVKAQGAYLIANKTYTDAVHLQYDVTCCVLNPDLFSSQLLWAGIAIIILIFIAIIWWRKFPEK